MNAAAAETGSVFEWRAKSGARRSHRTPPTSSKSTSFRPEAATAPPGWQRRGRPIVVSAISCSEIGDGGRLLSHRA